MPYSYSKQIRTNELVRFTARCIIVLAFGAFAATTGWADSLGTFTDLNITTVTGDAFTGELYTLDFGLSQLAGSSGSETVSGFGYLNLLSVDDGAQSWHIHNALFPLSTVATMEANHYWFDQHAEGQFLAYLSDTPVQDNPADLSDWTTVSGVASFSGYSSQGETGATPPSDDGTPAEPTDNGQPTISGYLRGGVGDLQQETNQCGPTSTANSLLWLIDKYALPTDKVPKDNGEIDTEAMVTEIAQAMRPNWDSSTTYPGLDRGELERGKKKLFEKWGWTVSVHGGIYDTAAQGASTLSFVEKELKKGQDVEFLIDWNEPGMHWVTVTGYIDGGSGNQTIIFHDPLQANGNHYWSYKNGDIYAGGKKIGTANRAVAESIVPEPATASLLAAGLAVLLFSRTRQSRRPAG